MRPRVTDMLSTRLPIRNLIPATCIKQSNYARFKICPFFHQYADKEWPRLMLLQPRDCCYFLFHAPHARGGVGFLFSHHPLACFAPVHAAESSSSPPGVAGIAPPPLPPATPAHAGCPPAPASEMPAVPASPRLRQTTPFRLAAARPRWSSPLPATEQLGAKRDKHEVL